VTGTNPAVVAVQNAYVAKVLDTLNEFDNVLWEIANEAGANSTKWQLDMVRFIREYEAKLPKQHPIGFTFQYGSPASVKQKRSSNPTRIGFLRALTLVTTGEQRAVPHPMMGKR